ncbi:MAG: hypothetical protein O3B78_05360 [Bacteroidetes bacterium]|nr:hypothetical protein [Bacteroidota bacterium]
MRTTLSILILSALASCANPVSPTGGAKDTTSPVLIRIDKTLIERKDTQLQRWTFVFDENMQSKGSVLLNPSDDYLEQRGKVHRNEVSFDVPLSVKQLSLGKSLSDLNENNLYKALDSHQLHIQVSFKDAKSLRNAKGQWVLTLQTNHETHWVLPSESSPTGLSYRYSDPAPDQSKQYIFFLDANANKQYDSTEVYGRGILEAETNTTQSFEYPPLVTKADSSHTKPADSTIAQLMLKGEGSYFFKEPKTWVNQPNGEFHDSLQLELKEGTYILVTYKDENNNHVLDWPDHYEIHEVICKPGLINEIIVKKEEITVDFVGEILR